MPPMYMTSGCTMSTACISIMRAQVAEVPVLLAAGHIEVERVGDAACVSSSFQYGQGSS